MPTLDRDGVTISYEDHGSGPAILLTHGYASSSHMWAAQVAALEGRYRVITWDMRGHGKSDSPADQAQYSERHTVDDMAAILRACGLERAVIGGLSLGGYMSMAFNVAYPGMVRGLMLFDTGPGYRNDQARAGWNETAEARAKRFEEVGLEAVGRGAEVRSAVHRSAEGLARAARGMLAQVDARIIDSLPGITVPTLVLVGERDRPYLAGTDYMAVKIPGAARIVIADAGHSSNIDQPAAFLAAVETFLARVGS